MKINKLPSNYDHKLIDQKWQDYWSEHNIYKWNEQASRENSFIIDTPPPTVSGLLHMGHIFSYTQTDFIARFQRMLGKNVFYPMGFDDNGLPTERLVEKVKNIRASSMDRESFIDICLEVVKDAEEEFRDLFKSIALSVDWSQEYQTINKNSRTMSQLSFLELYSKNHAYRQLQPTLWDPIDQTALAQADIVDVELSGIMQQILFTTDSGDNIIIATTRPELIPACVAVFFNPKDARYQHLQGKQAISPLFKVSVPILADDNVDIEKGTGLVMCCTFGDINDIHWWKTHKLPTRVILTKNGRLANMENIGSAEWPTKDIAQAKYYIEQLNGLKIKEAKVKIVEFLKEQNLLVSQQEIIHNVKCAERSGSPLEILVTPQWFIKILDKKEELLEKSAECNWHPKYMKTRLDNWIKGLNWDWCISRQRFFGVPFPVWYSRRAGEEGKILLAELDQLPVNPLTDLPKGYNKDEVEPDIDVMDTWATSSISPQLNSLAINENFFIDYKRHQKLFPADLRPQAHEIIRTWAFYTIVKSLYHEQTIPWKNLMISGWCLAADKTKMSKSKGNVITPVNLIKEKGTDIIRYWSSNSRLGADIAYSEETFKLGKKLINKLWNAAKFASLHLEKLTNAPKDCSQEIKDGAISYIMDLWLLSKLQLTINEATKQLTQFEYCIAREFIEEFFWQDFCDNYLEIIKVRAYNAESEDNQGQISAIKTIYFALDAILRLFAPYLPHITEELYQNIFPDKIISIHQTGSWPKPKDLPYLPAAIEAGNIAIEILDLVRKFKADNNLSLKSPIKYIEIISDCQADITAIRKDLMHVTNSEDIIMVGQFNGEENILISNNYKLQISIKL